MDIHLKWHATKSKPEHEITETVAVTTEQQQQQQ